MELLDIYDLNNKLTGKVVERGSKNVLDGEFIKLCTIWIENDNKFLIQKCSKEKNSEYAVTGGHVPSGKTSFEQIMIETEEELGVSLNENNIKLLGSIPLKHAIFDVYFYHIEDIKKINFILQQEEVENLYWLSKDEIQKLIDNEEFRKSSTEQFKKFISKLENEHQQNLRS